MLRIYHKLKQLIKVPDVLTESLVFLIHSQFTAIALFAFCIITTATNWVGESIKCVVGGKETSKAIVTFCWIKSKYTMADSSTRVLLDDDYEEGKKYYPYYQWVGFALFVQATLCYLPKYLWNASENGRLKTLIMKMDRSLPNRAEMEEKKKKLLRYLLSHAKMNKVYVLNYWFCEGLCLVNILLQIAFMNAFLGGGFLGYGWEVFSYLNEVQEDRMDPMIYLFPKMTKCEFEKYGPSGTVINKDALCLLPINNINEKIYVAIWVWYMLLAPLLLFLVVFRLLISGSVALRVLLLRGTNQRITRKTAVTICSWGDVGDFWIVFMLSANIRAYPFNNILERLAKAIENPVVRQEIMDSSLEKKPQSGEGDCVLNIGYD